MSEERKKATDGHTTTQGYPDMADPEFSRPRASNASEIRTDVNEEQQRAPRPRKRRRYAILIGVVTIFYLVPILLWNLSTPVAAVDYSFPTEYVDWGSSSNAANRDAEDGTYQTIQETDSANDVDYNSPSKSVTYGTEGGTFPTALQTSNDIYWTLT